MFELFMEGSGIKTGGGDVVFVAINPTPGDGGEETSFVTGVVEHFPNHEGSGGLTIGAGDGNDAEMFGGEVVFAGGVCGLEPMVG